MFDSLSKCIHFQKDYSTESMNESFFRMNSILKLSNALGNN